MVVCLVQHAGGCGPRAPLDAGLRCAETAFICSGVDLPGGMCARRLTCGGSHLGFQGAQPLAGVAGPGGPCPRAAQAASKRTADGLRG